CCFNISLPLGKPSSSSLKPILLASLSLHIKDLTLPKAYSLMVFNSVARIPFPDNTLFLNSIPILLKYTTLSNNLKSDKIIHPICSLFVSVSNISFILLIKLSLLSSPLPMPYLFQASSTDNTSNLSKIALPNTTLSPLFLFSFFTKKKNDSPSVSTLKLLVFFLQKLTSSMLLFWDKYVNHSL